MRAAMVALATSLILAVAPSAADAEFGLVPGSVRISLVDAAGQPDLRAGGHPDRLITGLAFNATPGGQADGNPKDIVIDLPAGLIGDPGAVPQCTRLQFVADACPAASQVGVTRATFAGFGEQQLSIYNVVPEPDDIAEFGFFALIVPIRIGVTLRAEGDYGTRIELSDLPQDVPLQATEIELWGVPADHQSGTGIPRKPFLANPVRCDQQPSGIVRVRSWQEPGEWLTDTASIAQPLSGCQSLAFAPGVDAAFDTTAIDTPVGTRVDVTLPQNGDPDGLATPHLREATVGLPEGLTLSAGVADGLTSCEDGQLRLGSTQPPSCPESSKIGRAELLSPVLPAALHGDIYIGRQRADDPYRLFVTAKGPGFVVKLKGSLRADPSTGRLSLVMSQLPQVPFSRFSLRFKGGPRAPLATPARCGPGAVTAAATSYAGGSVTVSDPVAFGGGPACLSAAPFAPLFVGGASPPVAGGDSSLSVTVRRRDGEQTLDRVTLDLPPGVAARLAGVARCSATRAATGACAAASRIGSVVVDAGAGPSPFQIAGNVYLTGPYRQAPFGLALVLRAIAGPFDLGTIVVSATLAVDPVDGHLTVTTDRLPQVVEGIPLRLRMLGIDIDRPGFLLNPTGCRPNGLTAAIRSASGTTAQRSAPFTLGGCRKLRFAPDVTVDLTGREALHGKGRPGLAIGLRPAKGHANMRSAAVKLPRGVELDSSVVSVLCTKTRARRGRCPKGSRVGTTRARTPLLGEALTGSVFLVQAQGRAVPELWAVLDGAGIRLIMRSKASRPRKGQQVSNTFVDLPDLPMSAFSMRLRGGKGGLLSVSRSLCRGDRPRRMVARTALVARNGMRRSGPVRVRVRPSCRRG